MNCKNCGAEINEGALFCGNCGMKIVEEPAAPVVEEPVTEQPVVEEPAVEENVHQVYTEYQEQGTYHPPVIPEAPEAPAGEIYVPAERPNTILWIVLTAIEIFTCCMIPGIIGLIFAVMGHISAEKEDFADAEKKIKYAKISFWIGIGLGVLAVIAAVVIFIFFAGIGIALTESIYYW